jgi:Mg-chelatase subunit ChlD
MIPKFEIIHKVSLCASIMYFLGGCITPSSDMFHFEVITTTEYVDNEDHFSAQSEGVLVVEKRRNFDEYTYGYTFESDVSMHNQKIEGNIVFPLVSLDRNSKSERFVGGHSLLRNPSLLANVALRQVRQNNHLTGKIHEHRFHFKNTPEFPDGFSFSVQAKRQKVAQWGECVVALAIADPFDFEDPETGEKVIGDHRLLILLDPKMEDVIFLVSRFTAALADGSGKFQVEGLMHRLEGEKVVLLQDIDGQFTEYFGNLRLSSDKPNFESNTGLPVWAVHSLAVRDAADLVASAAIEGKPNFAVTATIGLILFVDTAVSATTGLLQQTGTIDWKWDGIPSYLGQGIGLTAAKGWENAFDKEVDEAHWQEFGGLGGDVASLFVPSSWMGAGIKVSRAGHWGGTLVKRKALAGKTIRISKHGLDIIRTGKGWQSSVKIGRRLATLQDFLGAVRVGVDAGEIVQERPKDDESSEDLHKSIFIIFDTSSSMNEVLDGSVGRKKIDIAKASLLDLLGSLERDGAYKQIEWAIMIFNGCGVSVVQNFTTSVERVREKVSLLRASGKTPLATALRRSREYAYRARSPQFDIVLLSDGEETCGGNPIQEAREINDVLKFNFSSIFDVLLPSEAEATGPGTKRNNISLNVIGFDVRSDKDIESQLRKIALAAKGNYYSAGNVKELTYALKKATGTDDQVWIYLFTVFFVVLFGGIVGYVFFFTPQNDRALSSASLVPIEGATRGMPIVLGQYVMTFGASPDNTIVLENDPYISAHHAMIEFKNQTYQITDSNSKNGVFLNDQRILSSILTEKDVIQMGDYRFRFTKLLIGDGRNV